MDYRDLRPGDILLFAGTEGHPLSEAIMWLTKSPISHAALVGEQIDSLIDAVPPHVRSAPVAKVVGTERKVWVRRLKQHPSDMRPVLDEAEKHLNAETDYAETNLVLLAGLILHRRLPLSDRVQSASRKFFRRAARRFSEGLHTLVEGREGKSMVCSEFVYTCYENAGPRYHLLLDGHQLSAEGASFAGSGARLEEGSDLLELAIEAVEDQGVAGLRSAAGEPMTSDASRADGSDDEALVRELLDAWKEARVTGAGSEPGRTAAAADFGVMEIGGRSDTPALDPGLALAVRDFAEMLAPGVGRTESLDAGLEPASFGGGVVHDDAMSLRTLRATRNSRGGGTFGVSVASAGREHAFFVTPADLYQSVENLETVGVLNEEAE